MSPRHSLLGAALLCLVTAASFGQPQALAANPPAPAAAKQDDLVARLQRRFAPLRQEWIAVSPDGRYVAYSKRFGPELYVLTAAVNAPAHVIASVKIGSEAASEFMLPPPRGPEAWNPGHMPTAADSGDTNFRPFAGKAEPKIYKLAWATNSRVIVFTNVNVPKASAGGGLNNRFGAFLGFNADGSRAAILANVGDFDGLKTFAPYDARRVIVQTGRDQAVLMDLYSGRTHGVKFSEWTNRKRSRPQPRVPAAEVQTDLRPMFPDREIETLDSDFTGENVAVLIDGPADPGHVYVYRAVTKDLLDFGERAPELPPAWYAVHRTDFTVAADRTVQLRLIWPRARPKAPPGIVVICPDDHRGVPLAYSPEVMAFVDMGYPVLQFGIKQSKGLAPADFYDVFRDIRERTHWADSEFGKLPPEIALVGLTSRASEAAYLALVRDDGIVRGAVLQHPVAMRQPPADLATALAHRIHGPAVPDGYLHDALCVYPSGPSKFTQDIQMKAAGFYCAPLEKAGTYVDYLPENFAAATLRTKEERALLYSKIDAFLTGALRRAKVQIGKEHVVESDRGASARGTTAVPPPDVKPSTPAVDALAAPVTLPSHP